MQSLLKITGGIDASVPDGSAYDGFSCALKARFILLCRCVTTHKNLRLQAASRGWSHRDCTDDEMQIIILLAASRRFSVMSGYHQKPEIARLAVVQAVLAHDIQHEILSAEQVNERFPGYRLPTSFRVCLPSSTLRFNPHRCARKRGVVLPPLEPDRASHA